MITARRLIDLAARLLPPHRRDWAEAMRAELAIIPPAEQYGFALGCLWTALCERINLMKAFVALGRWGVGLVTTLFGAFFGLELFNGLTHAELRDHGFPWLWLLPWASLMAISYVAAGVSLILWRPRLFTAACALALLPAVGLTLIGALNHIPRVDSYAWPFAPLALLIVAAAFLSWLDRKPQKPLTA
jgi:hypothetical protein